MLVSLDNVSLSFGDKQILNGVSVSVEEADRICLIGANGIGKSTLLNVLTGRLEADSGEVYLQRNTHIGFLEQNSGLSRTNTIYKEMRSVFTKLLETEEKMRSLEKEISKRAHDEKYNEMCEEYSRLQTYFEAKDGYHIDLKIKTILNGMGFEDKSYDLAINSLSGGEKTRLALAKLLLEEPDLLVLDEPTNHLDFKTLMWLEDYLKSYKGALLIVSHDRYFIDKTSLKIWEIENKRVVAYNGNYTKYKTLKAERLARMKKEYEAQQNKINSMREYAEKNIVRASTSNMAKSRLHQLEHIELLEKPDESVPTPKFRFEFERNPVKDVLSVEGLSLAVGSGDDRQLLCENLNFEVKRGEKIALIGPNGIGKSTLLKAILGLSPQEGQIRWGGNVKTGYYEQENLTLDRQNTALEELWGRFPLMAEYEVRGILGQVLMTGDNVFKKIEVLSGGERARTALAIIMTEKANTLVLDEPTNHLDLQSKEALEDALVSFSGTMIFVSHDRYFLNAIPTKIIELNKKGLTVYDGNFDFYLGEQAKASQEEAPKEKPKIPESEKSNYRSKKERAEQAKRRARIKQLEELIAQAETEIAELEALIASPEVASDYERLGAACDELEAKKSAHDEYFLEWAELSEE